MERSGMLGMLALKWESPFGDDVTLPASIPAEMLTTNL
jgi:hypothetical protein